MVCCVFGSWIIRGCLQSPLFMRNQALLTIAYSPHPLLLLAFFLGNWMFQFSWLSGCLGKEETHDFLSQEHTTKVGRLILLCTYVFHNLCMATWSVAWLNANYQIAILTDMVVQFGAVLRVGLEGPAETVYTLNAVDSLMYACKTIGAMGVTTLVTDEPWISAMQTGLIALIFLTLAVYSYPNPTLGLGLLYVLLSLVLGEYRDKYWHDTFVFSGLLVSVALVISCLHSRSDKLTHVAWNAKLYGEEPADLGYL